MPDYPEHDKLRAIKERSQPIGNFLENTPGGMRLCEYSAEWDEWFPTNRSTENILAEYFDIDLAKIEEEKRTVIEEQQKLNDL